MCEGVDDHRNGISNGGTAPTSACVGCHCCYKTNGCKIDSDDLPGDGGDIDYGCDVFVSLIDFVSKEIGLLEKRIWQIVMLAVRSNF